MKNIQQIIIKKVGVDRLLHFAFGGWISCLAPTWYYAVVLATTVGFLKELIYDNLIKKSKFDVIDWACTMLGGVVTAIVVFIYYLSVG